MKQVKSIILVTSLSITFFVIGLLYFEHLFEAMLPDIDNVRYQTNSFGGQFRTKLMVVLVLALVPVFVSITWRYAPIVSKGKKLISVIAVIACMVLAIVVRQQMLAAYLFLPSNSSTAMPATAGLLYPVDKLYFEYCLFAGLCIGSLIAWFLLGQKKHEAAAKDKQ
jgi:hypothetical protein